MKGRGANIGSKEDALSNKILIKILTTCKDTYNLIPKFTQRTDMVSDLNRKINAVSPRSQLLCGVLITAIVVACYLLLVDEKVLENTSQFTEKWSKLGILLTMFGTIFTLFKAIVLFGYKEAAIALLKVEQELSSRLFFANETSDHEKASQLQAQAAELEKQKAELQSKPDVDIYDKSAIFFSIALLEVGLALQLFAI